MKFYESLTHLPALLLSELEEAQNKEPIHALLLDVSKISDEDFKSQYPLLKEHPFLPHVYYYDKDTYDFGKSWLYDAGVISIQDPAAMLVPFYLAPSSNETVLDLCAAPGGKTIFASLLMHQQGTILCNDLSYPRAKNLSQNIERMGLRNCIVTSDDFSKVYHSFEGMFDKIILDAPCSGSAMFRKDELAEKDWSEEKVHRCALIQQQLLEIAYAMLKPGGRIIYSTCSFSYEENEGNVLSFLASHKDMSPIAVDSHDCFYHPSGLIESVYLFPHLYQGEGQFFCLMEKEATRAPVFARQDKQKPLHVSPVLLELVEKAGLKDFSISKRGQNYYGIKNPLPVEGLHVLRYGVELGNEDKYFMPAHALARASSSALSLPLTKEQAFAYFSGETFSIEAPNGFHVVSYQNCPLGWVKVVEKTAKNHYPKGLRYRYK